MAIRPTWEGHLRLSLVICPVRLFKATEERTAVHFNLLHPETMNRVKQQWRDAETGEVVERRDLVRGYQVERDRYIVIEDEDLKKLRLESTRTIEIEKFVPARSIDRLYWDQPFYVVPDGKPAQEPFAVIRNAMKGEDQVALGRLVMANRERVAAVEVRGKGLLLTTLRAHDEVRDQDEYFDDIPDVKVDARMVEIARQIIAQAEGRFDPDEFRDRYEEALRALIAEKSGAAPPVHRPRSEPADSNVIDLMDALRRSLSGGRDGARQHAEKAVPMRDGGRAKKTAEDGAKPARSAPSRTPAPRDGGRGQGGASRSRRRA